MKSIVAWSLVSLMAHAASACPRVVVPQASAIATVGIAQVAVVPQTIAVAVPQVSVQTFALPPVAASSQVVVVPAAPVQVLAAPACAKSAGNQRVGILGRLRGTRSLAISRTVSR